MAAKARHQQIVEPLREGIEEDLRTLHRQPGVLREERLLGLSYLTEYLGDGSEQAAYDALLELRRHHGRTPQTDIHAFFYTSGYKVGGTTLDVRLRRYAAEYGVVEKTALRRSNRGATKLSHLVRDGASFPRPWGNLIVTQAGSSGYIGIGINVVEDQTFRRPRVIVNGEKLVGLNFALISAPYGAENGLLYASEMVDKVPLGRSGGRVDPLLTVEIQWPQPIWPTWRLAAHLADTRLYAWLDVRPSGTAEIKLLWFANEGDSEPDRPLAQ